MKKTVRMPEKILTEAAWNRGVTMTFLLFGPASKRWFGLRKTENPEGTDWVDFVTFILQSDFDALLCYELSVTLYGASHLKVMDPKTLIKCRWSCKVCITVYIYTLGEFARHEFASLWLETICQTLFLCLWGNKHTSTTMDNYRNSPTIKFCADLFLAHRCPSVKFKERLERASMN